MILRRGLRKRPEIPRAIGDHDGPDLRHAQAELRKRLKKRRHLVPVLENAALAVEQLRVLRQRTGIIRPELTQRRVDQLAPRGGAALEHLKLLRTEQNRRQKPLERRCGLLLHTADVDLPWTPSGENHGASGLPAACGKKRGVQIGKVRAEAHELLRPRRAEAAACGQIRHRLKQIRLALRIFPEDQIDARNEARLQARVISEIVERERLKPHARLP